MRIAALLLSGLWISSSALADYRYQGEARNPDSGVLLYEEDHLLQVLDDKKQRRLVLYRCADGAAFARKQVDYGADASAPAFVLEDARFGYREGMRRQGQSLAAFFRPDDKSPEQSAALTSARMLVVDAGFDEFVLAHWEALTQGDTLTLAFLVPSRLETLRFKLKRIRDDTISGESVSVFRLSLGGFFGLFVPDIEVSYRDSDRRLMRFEGLSNIRASSDENLVARIDFPPQRQQAELAPEEWSSAMEEALVPCALGD